MFNLLKPPYTTSEHKYVHFGMYSHCMFLLHSRSRPSSGVYTYGIKRFCQINKTSDAHIQFTRKLNTLISWCPTVRLLIYILFDATGDEDEVRYHITAKSKQNWRWVWKYKPSQF